MGRNGECNSIAQHEIGFGRMCSLLVLLYFHELQNSMSVGGSVITDAIAPELARAASFKPLHRMVSSQSHHLRYGLSKPFRYLMSDCAINNLDAMCCTVSETEPF